MKSSSLPYRKAQHAFALSLVVLSLLFTGCDEKKEDEAGLDDELLGNWTSSCGPLLTAQQIDTAVNPDNQSIEDRLALFYFRKSYQFRTPLASEADAGRSILLNRMVMNISVYTSSTEAQAANCEDDDLFASHTETWEYNSNPVALRSDLEVSEDNGFPDDARAIDLSSLGFSRSYHTGAMVAALNTYSICEYTDWLSETSKSISDKRNCFANPLSLTDALVDVPSSLIVNPSFASQTYESEFIVGSGQFSIFELDDSTDPKSIKMGVPLVDEEGDFTDEEIVEQIKQSGDSQAHRHRILSESFMYFGE